MANLENKSFSPDNICLPPGQPAVLGEFPTGSDYADMGDHPGMAFPPVFAGMGGQDYGALVAGINDFSQQMFNELQNIKAKTPELNSPIDLSIEGIGMGGFNVNTQAPADAGNTSVNIGGSTLNIGGANLNVGGSQNLNQFIVPPEDGIRKASVIPAVSKTIIEGCECDGDAPGVGMANLLYRLTTVNITNEMENVFTVLREKVHNAKQNDNWEGVQTLAQEWSNLLHKNGGLLQDPDVGDEDDTLTQMIFNISSSSVPKDTRMLVSPDANGQLWVVVAACGDCE